MVLLAVNMAFTGYAVYRLSDLQQEQIDSANGVPTEETTEATVQATEQDSNSTATPQTTTAVSNE
tara:strand:+ start:1344 stop:1538 length:195 start_codon:yes stop_codon:yes gene_type:complete